jgi:alanine racemase
MAIVKGDAYGHGAAAVAATALANGARWLGVYTVQEGVALRRASPTAPILVFGPFAPAEATQIWDARLTPTIHSIQGAAELQRSARAGNRLPFHVKVDTGLTRAGIEAEDAVLFMRNLQQFPALEAQGLYTHFASADARSKERSEKQLQRFFQVSRALHEVGFEFAVRHAANSAATLDLPASHLDVVRAGISLYGYYPSAHVSRDVALRPALSLVSAVTRVTRVPTGTGVGYDHEFRCARASTIALVPIGYGDGLARRLGNGRGTVLIRGMRAPTCGRISMDQVTVDVTDLPACHIGDEAVLIGRQGDAEQSADDLGAQADTISYEILTGLMPRVPRIYVSSGAIVGVSRVYTELDLISVQRFHRSKRRI